MTTVSMSGLGITSEELEAARGEARDRTVEHETELLVARFEAHFASYGCNNKHTDIHPDFSVAGLWKAKQEFRRRHAGYDVLLDFGWTVPAFMIGRYPC